MKSFRRVVSIFSLVFCLSFLFSDVTVFAVNTDYANLGIKISMRDDGAFSVSTTNTGGTLYYCYKQGSTDESLAYPMYTAGVPICYYSTQGSLLTENPNVNGTAKYTDDTSTWSRANRQLQDLAKDSDYNRKEGQAFKVIDLTKPVADESNNWFRIGKRGGSLVKLYAVYESADGTLSDVVSWQFDLDLVEDATTPKIAIREITRTSSSVTLGVTTSVESATNKLGSLRVISDKFKPALIPLNKQSSYNEYKINFNGDYRFEVSTENGDSVWLVWHEVELNLTDEEAGTAPKGDGSSDTQAPTLSSSGIPDSIAFGDSFILTVISDEKASINFNGDTHTDVSSIDVVISDNGTYTFLANDAEGNASTYTVDISCFPASEDVAENKGYNIDIASYWNDIITGETLPQTGGIALAVIVAICLVGTGIGIYLVRRKKKIGATSVVSETSSKEEHNNA